MPCACYTETTSREVEATKEHSEEYKKRQQQQYSTYYLINAWHWLSYAESPLEKKRYENYRYLIFFNLLERKFIFNFFFEQII